MLTALVWARWKRRVAIILMVSKADSNVVRKMAIESGMRSLRDDGWLKVRQGTTSIAEVLRVTQEV